MIIVSVSACHLSLAMLFISVHASQVAMPVSTWHCI